MTHEGAPICRSRASRPRRTVKGFLKVMEQQVVVLVGFNCGIETLVEEGDVLINGRARSGALGRIQELKYGWRNERLQDAGNEAVVGVTDRDRTEVGRGVGVILREKNMLTKLKERFARRRQLAAREA